MRMKLNPEELVVDSFEVPAGPKAPPRVAYIEPDYSARNTCADGNCAPYTQGGLYQQTCNACTFTCYGCY